MVKIKEGNCFLSQEERDWRRAPPDEGLKDEHSIPCSFRFSTCELIKEIVGHTTTVVSLSSNKEGN